MVISIDTPVILATIGGICICVLIFFIAVYYWKNKE